MLSGCGVRSYISVTAAAHHAKRAPRGVQSGCGENKLRAHQCSAEILA